MSLLSPRESAQYITGVAKDVSISADGVKRVADAILSSMDKEKFSLQSWKNHELNPKTADQKAINWIFLVDTLNFSFWTENETEKFEITFGGKKYTGYWSLCAAINRAMEEGFPMCDPNFYSNLTLDELSRILRSDTGVEMPLMEERLQVLHESGKILLERFNGSFVNAIHQCDCSVQTLLNLVVESFPSFRDESFLLGQKVSFYKRAQILIGDIWACCEGTGYGKFDDIDSITMFADYRIPQALVYFGALKYSEDLLQCLKTGTMFNSGERLELEIRGCTIWAIELVCRELFQRLGSKGMHVNPILVDHYLWNYRREHNDKMKDAPFHRIRCIYY